VCRLRHNWPVLATGAMLVDLPGVRDANAARGKVAENYLKARSLLDLRISTQPESAKVVHTCPAG
jgi:hypothetical protein